MTLLWVLVAAATGPALAEKRVALVVGNSAYAAAGVPQLRNPGNDARLIAEALRKAGFTLVGGGAQLDLQKRPFEQALRAFRQDLSGADVGVFYYAGHGVGVGKLNYLMPVDADPKVEADVETDMLGVELVMSQMQSAGAKLKIIILDACRNNPLPPAARGLAVARGKDGEFSQTRSLDSSGGLASIDVPKDSGMVISFATAPGMVALDGSGADSAYSVALAEAIGAPDLGILGVFDRVNDRVRTATQGRQQPWVSASYGGQFRFTAGTSSLPAAASVSPPAPLPAPARPAAGADDTAWNYLKATTDVAVLRQFVLDFPAGSHLEEAQARIAAIEAAAERARLAVLSPSGKPVEPPRVPAGRDPLTREQERALKPGDAFRECQGCPVMVAAPAGSFIMGSPASEKQRERAEGPQLRIEFGEMFAVGRSPVSFDEWSACVEDNACNHYRPGDFGFGTGKHPVIFVSWNDAKAYVDWLSKKTKMPYRLLSDAEREYVGRGCRGTGSVDMVVAAACPSTPYWFGGGAQLTRDRANYDSRFSYDGSAKAQPRLQTVETDASEPNPFGILQVHGNVREWVEDCWNPTLSGQSPHGEARESGDCNDRVVRGGSWADHPEDLRSAKRSWETADHRDEKIGFRVARSLRN
jgi:formylglycine-generating enzyme required for sulfatase activity/uncharacterized caspase-like protein